MLGVNKVNQQKERILSILKVKGPSLPLQIARGIGSDGLFASAFLSELYAEKKLKMSSMKVGSSQLYFLEGQDALLENFIGHLNRREQEAFHLLKTEKVLEDETQTPVTRVALRAIKDFAIPMRVRISGDSKIFWKHFLLPDSEFEKIVTEKITPKEKTEKLEEKKKQDEVEEKTEDTIKEGKKKEEKIEKKRSTRKKSLKPKAEKEKVEDKKEKEEYDVKSDLISEAAETIEKKPAKEYEFSQNVKEHLAGKEIEVLNVISEKNKEFYAKVSANIIFGKQEMILFAKDKKTINDIDLALALQKAQAEKMPALFLSHGELNKKAKEYIKEWRNLVKFEKIKKYDREKKTLNTEK